jgi:hypothetical protein
VVHFAISGFFRFLPDTGNTVKRNVVKGFRVSSVLFFRVEKISGFVNGDAGMGCRIIAAKIVPEYGVVENAFT